MGEVATGFKKFGLKKCNFYSIDGPSKLSATIFTIKFCRAEFFWGLTYSMKTELIAPKLLAKH